MKNQSSYTFCIYFEVAFNLFCCMVNDSILKWFTMQELLSKELQDAKVVEPIPGIPVEISAD